MQISDRLAFSIFRLAAVVLLAVGAVAPFQNAAAQERSESVLEEVARTGVFKLGYRQSVAPFSYEDQLGTAKGYSVLLCQEIAFAVRQKLKLESFRVEYVPVTINDRFEALADGRAHVVCGATTATLGRRDIVDFTIPTFVTGAGIVTMQGGPTDFGALNGSVIGLVPKTTSYEVVQKGLTQLGVQYDVRVVEGNAEGFERLRKGEIVAYFGDRAILAYQIATQKLGKELRLSKRLLSFEPYALALPLGDHAFRTVADTTLSRLYRSGKIIQLFSQAFGQGAEPTELLLSLFAVNSLPE